jgi:hypothetical protein
MDKSMFKSEWSRIREEILDQWSDITVDQTRKNIWRKSSSMLIWASTTFTSTRLARTRKDFLNFMRRTSCLNCYRYHSSDNKPAGGFDKKGV